MAPIAKLLSVALDCPDPRALAEFYSAITGWPVGRDNEGWVELDAGGGPTIAFQLALDHAAPQWPSVEQPQQAHLDFDVADLDLAEAQVVALGARKTELQPGEHFRVFLDPAGHPFCLCLETPT